MQLVVMHEDFSCTFQDDLGPLMAVKQEMTPHVLHLGLRQGVEPDLKILDWCISQLPGRTDRA